VDFEDLYRATYPRVTAYEVLRDSGANRLLTLTGAHPSARVVRDAAQTAAAEKRLMPSKP
jgi:hypothetical protein